QVGAVDGVHGPIVGAKIGGTTSPSRHDGSRPSRRNAWIGETRDVARSESSVLCLPRGDHLRPRRGETLLAAALRCGVPLASSCGGRAVCGDCVVRIVAGAPNVSPPDADELAWRRRTGKGGDGSRLACCLTVTGP